MSLILQIDTATETAGVSIAENGILLAAARNDSQKEHAGFLHMAIKKILAQAAIGLEKIDAISVTNGPGSYTGLRVGLASAKGLCYALKKPLITIGSLPALAYASILDKKDGLPEGTLFCPMIDARRMEVYTAVYNRNMEEMKAPYALVLDDHSYSTLAENNILVFSGSGTIKWSKLNTSKNAEYLFDSDTTAAFCQLSYKKFMHQDFADLKYIEPLYVKEFFFAS